jgi:hypothetical protein
MRTPQTPKSGTITIVNRLPSGPAFGVLDETGEHMFITSRIAEVSNVTVGKKYLADYVVNSIPEKTPWFAVRLNPAPDTGEDTLDYDEVFEDLEAILGSDRGVSRVIDYMRDKGLKID